MAGLGVALGVRVVAGLRLVDVNEDGCVSGRGCGCVPPAGPRMQQPPLQQRPLVTPSTVVEPSDLGQMPAAQPVVARR